MSRFQVLRAGNHFCRYRGRPVLFSCFALPDMFFGGPEGDMSHFHVLHVGTSFWQYLGRRIPFSCFAFPNTSSAIRRASGPIFMFFAPALVFGGNEGVGSRFHLLRSQSWFPQYRVRRVPFSYFALPDSFSAVPRASGPVFMFCTPGLIFGGTDGVRSYFHVLHSRTHFR
jgi:hypothetical protein